MADTDHGYERGWCRYGFDTLDFEPLAIHSGAGELDFTVAFNRGPGKPQICFMVIPPETPQPAVGLHIHRDEPSGEDLEEWYVIIEGTGVMRFTNGDSVSFRAGDLLGVYPGTGHSVVATGDEAVRAPGDHAEDVDVEGAAVADHHAGDAPPASFARRHRTGAVAEVATPSRRPQRAERR